jgi:hypothetical protein
MAVTRETLRLLREIRFYLDQAVDEATEDLVRAWSRAWDQLVVEWDAAIAELQDLRDDGLWPTRAQVRRAERTTKALFLTRQALNDLAQLAGVRIAQVVPDVVGLAQDYLDVIASQYPRQAGGISTVAANLTRADQRQIEAIVRRTSGSIVSMLRPLSGEATGALYSGLVRGVSLGYSPGTVATRLLRRLEGAFNGGLTRAMVIARTELLDAHRAAAKLEHQANASVLQGWQWFATLDTKTCPSCWSQHGTVHDLTESGPDDHQQGRCARLPVTRSWSELGFDIPEPPSLVPDAEDVFASLTRAQQLQVMGAQRLALLDAGDIDWSDLSVLRTTRGWRDSYGVAPLSALV